MNLIEIKEAIAAGKTVYCKQDNYVVKEVNGNYYIVCTNNDYTIGLTWQDGVTLNDKEENFYTRGSRIHTRHAIGCSGNLHWQRGYRRDMATIREKYAYTHKEITSGKELCATLRAGEYAWPGGYQLLFIASDGGLLHFDCVRENLYQCIYSIRHEIDDGWRIVGCEMIEDIADGENLYCDHCGVCFLPLEEDDAEE